MNILVTGGAGYIGSHLVKKLLEDKHRLIIIDNLSQGHQAAILGGKFIIGDLADVDLLSRIMKEEKIEAVVHLAAHSLVEESMQQPAKYYYNNVFNGLNLLQAMVENRVKYLVFSSTAAVYGRTAEELIEEDHPTLPNNPYGESKLFFEKVLARYNQLKGIKYISLRYFNAAGADPEGLIGEDHNPETHLIPIIFEKALGKREGLFIYGDNYPTRDGTCIRDYIHVNDLASAHILALQALIDGMSSRVYNLGNGRGYSVREVIDMVREIASRPIEAIVSKRRAGDPPVLVASSKKIRSELGWQPDYPELKTIIKTAWNWHKKGGY